MLTCSRCQKPLNYSDLRARSEKLAKKALEGQPVMCLECQMDQKMGICSYCGQEAMMTWDHVIPQMLLKRYNLNHALVIPCCHECNQSKGSLTLEEWQARFPPNSPQYRSVMYLLMRLNSPK